MWRSLTGDRFLDKTDTTSNSELGCVAFTWAMVNVRHTVVSARCGRINTGSAATVNCAYAYYASGFPHES